MDFTRLLLRIARLVRNPPSWRMFMVLLAVLAIAAVIYGVEAAGLWPDWATANRARPPRILRP